MENKECKNCKHYQEHYVDLLSDIYESICTKSNVKTVHIKKCNCKEVVEDVT